MNVSVHLIIRVFFFLLAVGTIYTTYMLKVQEPDFHLFPQVLTMMASGVVMALCTAFWPSHTVWWVEKLQLTSCTTFFFGYSWLMHAGGETPGEKMISLIFMIILGALAFVSTFLPKREYRN